MQARPPGSAEFLPPQFSPFPGQLAPLRPSQTARGPPPFPLVPTDLLTERPRREAKGEAIAQSPPLPALRQSCLQPGGAASASAPRPAPAGPARPHLQRQVVDAAQAGLHQQLQQPQERKPPEAREEPRTAGARGAEGRRGSHVCSSITSCFRSLQALPGLKGSGRRKGLEVGGGAGQRRGGRRCGCPWLSPRSAGPGQAPGGCSVGLPGADFGFARRGGTPRRNQGGCHGNGRTTPTTRRALKATWTCETRTAGEPRLSKGGDLFKAL